MKKRTLQERGRKRKIVREGKGEKDEEKHLERGERIERQRANGNEAKRQTKT